MTIVIYRDGVMAADSQVGLDGTAVGTYKKVIKTKDGWLAGASGEISAMEEFFNWVRDGRQKDNPPIPGMSGMMVSPKGEVFQVDENLIPYKMESEFYICGSGYAVAIGALAMGASPEKAVEITIKYSYSCGGPIEVVTLGKKK